MPIKSVDIKALPGAIKDSIVAKLRRADLSQLLVTQAQRRIDDGGDSEFKYPELWANKHPQSYRAGGKPLRDKLNRIYGGLRGDQQDIPGGVRLKLTGPLIAIYHQNGFKTAGPNYIPLSMRATRYKGALEAKADGLIAGKFVEGGAIEPDDADYVMAWRGVDVPQRKIVNFPPENIDEMKFEAARAIA